MVHKNRAAELANSRSH